jgi:3-carboxy-cis,cis-muconate cycloisomerase
MTASLFARTLAGAAMLDVFADRAIVDAMLAFEAALAEAEAAEGVAARGRADRGRDAHQVRCRCTRRRGARRRQRGDPAHQEADRRRRRARPGGGAVCPPWQHEPGRDRHRDGRRHAARARVDRRRARAAHEGARRPRSHARDHADPCPHAAPAGAGDQLRLQGRRLAGSLVRARAPARARTIGTALQLGGAVGTLASLGDRGPAVAIRVAERLALGPRSMPGVQRDGSRSAARSRSCAARSARSAPISPARAGRGGRGGRAVGRWSGPRRRCRRRRTRSRR